MRKQIGITLIALIITIIVLLILAGITIGVIKNNNIIKYAQDAIARYNAERDNEQGKLNSLITEIEKNMGNNNEGWWKITEEELADIENYEYADGVYIVAHNGLKGTAEGTRMILVQPNNVIAILTGPGEQYYYCMSEEGFELTGCTNVNECTLNKWYAIKYENEDWILVEYQGKVPFEKNECTMINSEIYLDRVINSFGNANEYKWWKLTEEELADIDNYEYTDGVYIVAHNGLHGTAEGTRMILVKPNNAIAILTGPDEAYYYFMSEEALALSEFTNVNECTLNKWYTMKYENEDWILVEYQGKVPFKKNECTMINSETYLDRVINSFGNVNEENNNEDKWWKLTTKELGDIENYGNENGTAYIVASNGLSGTAEGVISVMVIPNHAILIQTGPKEIYYYFMSTELLASAKVSNANECTIEKWYIVSYEGGENTFVEYQGEVPFEKNGCTIINSETYLDRVISSFSK